jgi:hypothetical protein
MATLDIRGTVVGETAIAIKAPCLVATTANITLSGAQTIDGVSVGNNSERVLVKNQTTASQNGIYVASTGAWVLAADFTNNNNVALGTLVLVTSGNVNAGLIFEQTNTDNPIVIGTSNIAFTALPNATAQAATSTTSLAIGTGSKTLAVQAGKAFAANQYVVIYETSNVANAMLAQITSYSGTSLVVNSVATGGSGTFTDWSIVLTNSAAGAGIQPPVGSGNVTGPGSATAGHLATFADGTGKVIQDSGAAGALAALNTLSAQYLASNAAAFGVNMLNGTITATATDGATSLTLAIKTLAGADPSATDPVWFIFRNATPGNGSYSAIAVTAALSTKIPAGSTLGSVNATPFRFWLAAINNAGTVELAVINCLSGTSIYPLAGWGIVNVTAFGGGANSAQVLYGTTSQSSVPYSVLGYGSYEVGSTLATAGTYATAPTRLELYRPGVPLPGQLIQDAGNVTGAVATGSTALALADSVPTNSQGDQYMSQAITPSSSANLMEIEAQAFFANSTAGSVDLTVAILQDSVSAALSAIYSNPYVGGGYVLPFRILHRMLAATLSATTFKLREGAAAGTNTFNGASGNRKLGGAFNSFMRVREIMT